MKEAIVTAFQNVYNKTQPYYITVGKALERIKFGASEETISEVRAGDKTKKTTLPVILWSGEFAKGTDDGIKDHSNLIVIDIDHVDAEETKSVLGLDQFVFACWTSPSGDGVKALVRISLPERHRDHFRALAAYFQNQYGLEIDPSGINVSRACFESHDPNIIIKEAPQTFTSILSEKAETQVVAKVQSNQTDYMKLNLAVRMIRNAIDGEKHSTLLRAAILCGGFIAAGRMEEEEAKRVLLREIERKDIDSVDLAIRTIADGVEQGKKLPIREVIEEENKAIRDAQVNDGDYSFISADDDDFKWITDFADGTLEVGLDTGSKILDGHFKYKKEFVILNGHSNVGKSTFMLYLMVNASIRHGWKWVIYSAENKTASTKMKLMQFAADLKLNEMTYHQRKASYEWVNKHFTIISNRNVYSYTDLLIFCEKLIRQQEVDGFFVDPYNSLKIELSGNSQIGVHQYHYQAASEFLTFSNSNNIAVWLNTHAVTEAQRRKGPDGLSLAPYAEDTEGGGLFVNRSDCFLTAHRTLYSPDSWRRRVTEFHVRKVREVETGSLPTPLDSPILFEMNTQHTSFGVVGEGGLFRSIFNPEPLKSFRIDDISPDIF